MKTDPTAIKAYIERMFGQESEGNLVVFERDKAGGRRRHMVVPYRDRKLVFDFLAAQPEDVHRYVAVALHDAQAYQEQTRRKETACSISSLALDIDLADGVHAAQNLPENEEQAFKLLDEAGLPEPTLIIHSGGGLYPIWQFQQPFTLQTQEDRSRIERLGRRGTTASLWKSGCRMRTLLPSSTSSSTSTSRTSTRMLSRREPTQRKS